MVESGERGALGEVSWGKQRGHVFMAQVSWLGGPSGEAWQQSRLHRQQQAGKAASNAPQSSLPTSFSSGKD